MSDINLDDIDETQAVQSREPLPDGWYTLKVVDAEIRETKDGEGRYVSYEFLIDVKGDERKHWENYNFDNKSEKAQQIALAQLKRLAIACGKIGGQMNFEQLIGKTFTARLKTTPAKNGYSARNAIAEYGTPKEASLGVAKSNGAHADEDAVPF